MLQPPSLKHVPRYPVTAFVAGVAIAATGLWWSGRNVDALMMDVRVWDKLELWRAFTSTLLHVNVVHLAFNLYWLWVFGTVVERVYGHVKTFGIYLLLAFGSALAEFSFLSGGVGLSGVGYGLWGLLWVLERRDARFAGTVDRQTSQTFVIWFFACIVMTITDVMPIANIAHGVGAVMGMLLGLAMSSQGKLKWNGYAGLAAVLAVGVLGSTLLWPSINFSRAAQAEVEYTGWKALESDENERAEKLLELSTRMRGARPTWYAWYNLGIARQRLKKYDTAIAAYEHAAQMPGAPTEAREAVQELKAYLSRKGLGREVRRETAD